MIKSNPTISYRKDYPRPGLVRSSWLNLDGSWAFLTDDSKLGESLEWQKHFPDAFQTIQVPFSYETAASGVHDETAHSCVWYQRPLTLPENWMDLHRLTMPALLRMALCYLALGCRLQYPSEPVYDL